MAKQKQKPPTGPEFDPEALRELARCFARAAVDELMAAQEQLDESDEPEGEAQV